jgi:glycosyltransferase involved in cell wall biosynthesis
MPSGASKSVASPLVSVIVTTKNEEKNIVNCLLSIKNQTYKNVELIVVDNFSKDNTVRLAQDHDAIVYFKGNERSAQRNYGVQVAKGKYVLYLDADMILNPALVRDCVEKLESDNIDALYIRERIVGKGFWISVRDFERSFYTGTVIDAVRFLKKKLFIQVGGFDETLVGPEDWDFDRKIRKVGRIAVVTTPIYHNEGTFNMERYLKKKSYYKRGIEEYTKKWGPRDSEIIKQVGIQYRLLVVFVEKGKWQKLLSHPILAFAMYLLRLRVALVYV